MRTSDNDGTENNIGLLSLGNTGRIVKPLSNYCDFRVTSFTKHTEPGTALMRVGLTKPISEGNVIINNSATLGEELQENETIIICTGASIKINHINTKINKKLLLEPDSKVVIVDARLIYENLSDISIEIGLPSHLDDRVETLGGTGGEIADDIQI